MENWILWDWNGTLLDDAEYGRAVMNELLRLRGLSHLTAIEDYRRVFRFPVSEYYAALGLDPGRFAEDAHIWMDAYMRGESACPLRQGAREALRAAAEARQAILTASKREHLDRQLARFDIAGHFDALLGLSHIYATSKVEIGQTFLRERNIDPARCCVIGDTLHDAQVARALGAHCVLCLGGHQDRQRLRQAGAPMADDPHQAAEMALQLLRR